MKNELPYLGWDDLDDGLRLVEWPERVPGLAAQADLAVALDYDGSGRSATLSALSRRGNDLVARLRASAEPKS